MTSFGGGGLLTPRLPRSRDGRAGRSRERSTDPQHSWTRRLAMLALASLLLWHAISGNSVQYRFGQLCALLEGYFHSSRCQYPWCPRARRYCPCCLLPKNGRETGPRKICRHRRRDVFVRTTDGRLQGAGCPFPLSGAASAPWVIRTAFAHPASVLAFELPQLVIERDMPYHETRCEQRLD